MLKLDNNKIQDKEIVLSYLCPDITPDNIHNFYDNWTEVRFLIPKEIKMTKSFSQRNFFQVPTGDSNKKVTIGFAETLYKASAGPIKFSSLPELGDIGYYCVFASRDETKEVDEQADSIRAYQKIDRADKFQFKYDPELNMFIRDLGSDQNEPDTIRTLEFCGSAFKDKAHVSTFDEDKSVKSVMSGDGNLSNKGTFYGIQEAKIRNLSKFILKKEEENSKVQISPEVREFLAEYVIIIIIEQ